MGDVIDLAEYRRRRRFQRMAIESFERAYQRILEGMCDSMIYGRRDVSIDLVPSAGGGKDTISVEYVDWARLAKSKPRGPDGAA